MITLNQCFRALMKLAAGFLILIAALTSCFYVTAALSDDQSAEVFRSAWRAFVIVGVALAYRIFLWLDPSAFGAVKLTELLRHRLHCSGVCLFLAELAILALFFSLLTHLIVVAARMSGPELFETALCLFFGVGLSVLLLLFGLLVWDDWRASRNRSPIDGDGPC
jgi:hypothetical protein